VAEISLRSRATFFVVSFLTASLAAQFALASETRVGEAVVIQNDVVRVAAEQTSQVNVGDNMLRDEVARTGTDSAARFVMADSTNLSIGPSATIKLDRTVFNDEHSYRDIAIRLTTGAFRFVTGHSEKAAYKITTPLATIGVRGTILDILSQRGRTTVVLQEGAASVCTLSFQCIQLTQAGDTAVITQPAARLRSTRPIALMARPGISLPPARWRPGSAASAATPMRPPPLPRRSMTAASCAGADHGKSNFAQPCHQHSLDRGGVAARPRSADAAGSRTMRR
jgi:FecR protein